MKLLTIALVSTLSLASIGANAATYKFVAGNDSPSTKLCIAAASDHLMQYRTQLRERNISNKFAANSITCNGQHIGEFAQQFDALRTAKLINRFSKNRGSITDIVTSKREEQSNDEVIIVTVN